MTVFLIIAGLVVLWYICGVFLLTCYLFEIPIRYGTILGRIKRLLRLHAGHE